MAKPRPPTVLNKNREERMKAPPKWEQFWPQFEKKCRARLRKGHKEYTDMSFDRPLSSLLRETEEEIYDQILWSFIALTRLAPLWGRIQRLEDAIGTVEVENWLLDQPIPDLTQEPFEEQLELPLDTSE